VLKRKREAERRAEDGSGLSNGDVNKGQSTDVASDGTAFVGDDSISSKVTMDRRMSNE